MLNLAEVPRRFIAQHGRERTAELIGVSPATMAMWLSRGKFPIDAVQKLLDADPTPIHEIKPLYTLPARDPKLAILIPSNRKPEPDTVAALARMFNSAEMQIETFNFNSIYHVRNMAAQWFLDRNAPWSFWSDDDMIPQCGDAAWFKAKTGLKDFPDVYAGLNSIHRMLVHGKKFVSGVYPGRKKGAPMQFAGADTTVVRQMMARGPSSQIQEVEWTGFGCALIHRDVFLDIIRTQPEIEVKLDYVRKKLGYRYSFFSPIEQDYGDDISFCGRAKKSGHKIFVDFAVMPGHIGSHVFTYRDQSA